MQISIRRFKVLWFGFVEVCGTVTSGCVVEVLVAVAVGDAEDGACPS